MSDSIYYYEGWEKTKEHYKMKEIKIQIMLLNIEKQCKKQKQSDEEKIEEKKNQILNRLPQKGKINITKKKRKAKNQQTNALDKKVKERQKIFSHQSTLKLQIKGILQFELSEYSLITNKIQQIFHKCKLVILSVVRNRHKIKIKITIFKQLDTQEYFKDSNSLHQLRKYSKYKYQRSLQKQKGKFQQVLNEYINAVLKLQSYKCKWIIETIIVLFLIAKYFILTLLVCIRRSTKCSTKWCIYQLYINARFSQIDKSVNASKPYFPSLFFKQLKKIANSLIQHKFKTKIKTFHNFYFNFIQSQFISKFKDNSQKQASLNIINTKNIPEKMMKRFLIKVMSQCIINFKYSDHTNIKEQRPALITFLQQTPKLKKQILKNKCHNHSICGCIIIA